MGLQSDVVTERDEEGIYVASVPQLQGCHAQARSLDQLMGRVREAIELCLEVEGESAQRLEFIGVQRITIAARVSYREQVVSSSLQSKFSVCSPDH